MNQFIDVASSVSDQAISEIHQSLRAPRRRLIILLLANRVISHFDHRLVFLDHRMAEEEQLVMTARELSKRIAAHENSIPIEEVRHETYHNVYCAVTQHHLDRLHQSGAIVYDPDRKTVEPGRNLLLFASIALITSPMARMYFDAERSGVEGYHDED